MGVYIQADDVLLFAPTQDRSRVEALVEDAEAFLTAAVPDLRLIPATGMPLIKATLRTAILRWLDAGSGVVTTQSDSAPGGYSHSQTIDASKHRTGFFFDDELARIRSLVPESGPTAKRGRAFAVDMMPGGGRVHEDGCSRYWGCACDCGLWAPMVTPVAVTLPTVPIPAGEVR